MTVEELFEGEPPREYSAWLRTIIAKRIAELQSRATRGRVGFVNGVMVTHLAHDANPGDPDDRACDKCRAIVPPKGEPGGDQWFIFSHELRGARPGVPDLVLVGGFCMACAQAEGLAAVTKDAGGVE